MRRPAPRTSGFTLIEVMLAVAIVAIMSALVWASFGRLLRVTQEIEAYDAYWHGVRTAMNRISREVGAAFLSDHYDATRYDRTDPADRPTFFTLDDRGDLDRLAFTAFVNRRLFLDEKTSDQAVVEYLVDTDDEGRRHLYRRQKNVIDEEWEYEGERYVLVEDIEAFDVQWWDAEDEAWRREWDTRDEEQKNRIPRRLRIAITTTDPDGIEHELVTQARVMMNRPLDW